MTSAIQVWTPTTQGISKVLGLVAEDPDVQSVICLNHGTEALPVSSAYHQFVRKGTGIIHRHVGHGAFRLDVDHRVDQGSSWQLPVFLAHLLLQQGRLWQSSAISPNVPPLVWIASGTVNVQGEIGAVSGFVEKLRQIYEALRQLPEQPFQLFFPLQNQADIAAALLTLDEATRQFFSQSQPIWLENINEISQLNTPQREQKFTLCPAPDYAASVTTPTVLDTQAAPEIMQHLAHNLQTSQQSLVHETQSVPSAPTPWLKWASIAVTLTIGTLGYLAMPSSTTTTPHPEQSTLAPLVVTENKANGDNGIQTPVRLHWASCQHKAIISQTATMQGEAEAPSLCQLRIEVPSKVQIFVIKLPESTIVKSGQGELRFFESELPNNLTASGYHLLFVQFSVTQSSATVKSAIEKAQTLDFVSGADLGRQLKQQGIAAQVYQQIWKSKF